MSLSLENLRDMATRSIVGISAPSIAKGLLVETLHREVIYQKKRRKIDVKLLCELVDSKVSLWSLFPETTHRQAVALVSRLGNVEWFTADWAIDAIKEEHAALASLFLSWPKARNWLKRQMEEIKGNLAAG